MPFTTSRRARQADRLAADGLPCRQQGQLVPGSFHLAPGRVPVLASISLSGGSSNAGPAWLHQMAAAGGQLLDHLQCQLSKALQAMPQPSRQLHCAFASMTSAQASTSSNSNIKSKGRGRQAQSGAAAGAAVAAAAQPSVVTMPAPTRPPPFPLDPMDQHLWAAFSAMDRNGDNCIDWVELREALERLGLPCTPEYLVAMMNEYDLNRDMVIDWNEFKYYVHKRETEIEQTFKAFDIDGNGEISVAELKQVLARAGIPAGQADVENMVARLDCDQNSTISYEEFRRFAAFLPAGPKVSSSPMLFAAWWRSNSALVPGAPLGPAGTSLGAMQSAGAGAAAGLGLGRSVGARALLGSPFKHFVVFDMLVRGALGVTLLAVTQQVLDIRAVSD